MAPFVYSAEGIKLAKSLWEETMEELAFAHTAEVIRQLSA